MNYQHLHYQFPAEPSQRWHVIEDRSLPHPLRFRHPCKPAEKPDPKVNFGVSELSARLEHAGVEYIRIALGNDAKSFDWAFCMISGLLRGVEVPGDGHWYPVIPWVRDDGFYAVAMRKPMPFRDACHLFGFDIPAGKPSVPKRIKRDVARGLTSLCQEYACDVFDLMRDDECVKEEIGFYNPASWADEDGNPVMSENRWKLWRMYAAGLPAMQFRNCRDAFYRTQMESPENTDPDRFRIRFREPQDLMTVKAEELAGAAVRRYLLPEPFVFDKQGYPHWERSTLPNVDSVYLGGLRASSSRSGIPMPRTGNQASCGAAGSSALPGSTGVP